MSAKSELEVKNLSWQYKKAFSLKNISFSIPAGSRTGIMGPNGAGKSTIIKLLLKILPPPAESVYLDGADIFRLAQKDIAKRMSYVPQLPVSPDGFTVEEIIRMSRYMYGDGESGADTEIVERVMDNLNIREMRYGRVSELSGGEYQRVLLARALCQQTGLIILDEPTNHLDLSYQLGILDMLKKEQLRRELSVIAVFHDINFALEFCDRIVLIKDGEIMAIMPPEELARSGILSEAYGLDFRIIENDGPRSLYLIPSLR